MKKTIKKLIIIFAFFFILILIATFVFLRIYLPTLKYQNAFPNQPKIGDIATPEAIFPLSLSDVYFYYPEGDNIYYLSNDKVLNTYNLNTGQFSSINWTLNIVPESIQDIKWLTKSKMLVFYADQDFYNVDFEEDLPSLQNSDIKKIYIDLINNKKIDLDPNTVDAFFDEATNNLYSLQTDEFNQGAVYQISLDTLKKDHIANLEPGEITSIVTQVITINDEIYYLKGSAEINLYRFNVNDRNEELVLKNINGANISPQGEYMMINDNDNAKVRSYVYNLQTKTIDYIFPITVLISRVDWDKSGNNMYYVMGENLKMGDEQEFLNRRPSYVFFKYQAQTKTNIQLNNHIYADPIDPQNLKLDRSNGKLYFIDIYLLQNSLYYLNLN